MTVNGLLTKAKQVDIPFAVENSLIETEAEYVELQQEQLYAGKLSDGTEIERIGATYKGYAPTTIQIKERKGQPTDRITLKDTGDFYSQVFSDPRSDGIHVDSADEKSEKLQRAYGKKIFGLSETYRQQYIDQLRPVFVAEVQKQLQ